jgi:hypothetical protein
MAGMTLIAVPTTIVATGKVDKLFKGASALPIIPPTNSIKTLSDIKRARQAVNIQTFLGRLNIEQLSYMVEHLFLLRPLPFANR